MSKTVQQLGLAEQSCAPNARRPNYHDLVEPDFPSLHLPLTPAIPAEMVKSARSPGPKSDREEWRQRRRRSSGSIGRGKTYISVILVGGCVPRIGRALASFDMGFFVLARILEQAGIHAARYVWSGSESTLSMCGIWRGHDVRFPSIIPGTLNGNRSMPGRTPSSTDKSVSKCWAGWVACFSIASISNTQKTIQCRSVPLLRR